MRKTRRVFIIALPFILLVPLLYISFPPPSEAELWLREQAQDATSLHVSYGSTWPGSIWKYITITDREAIRKVLVALRCEGSLTRNVPSRAAGGVELNGYNTTYYVTIGFRKRRYEYFQIHPGNFGRYLIVRNAEENPSKMLTAVTRPRGFQRFLAALHASPAKRSAGR